MSKWAISFGRLDKAKATGFNLGEQAAMKRALDNFAFAIHGTHATETACWSAVDGNALTYDDNGNLSTDDQGRQYVYDAWNRLLMIRASDGTALTYDNAGDTTTDDQGHTLVWDAWNRLVAVTSGGSTLASYSYDGFGHEIRKTVSGTTTDLYLSASWQVLEEDQGGQAVERDVYSPVYVDALVMRDRDTDANGSLDERLFVTTDANFNVTAIANNSGVVQERFTYSAYGIRTDLNASFVASADSRAWVVGWQGLRWDADTGMFYARHRWYSPTQMRWTSWDLIGYGDGMNPYLADAANPINRVDPKGLKQVQLDADAFIPWDWVQVPITLPINMLMSLTDIVDNLDYGVRSTVAGALLGPLGPGVVGPPPKPSPTFTSYVAGDGRGFSLTPRAHHRIATGVTIETDSLLSPTGEVAGSYYRDIGSSTARYDATSGGATATILKYSALGTLTDSHSVIRTSPCSVHVHLEANGSVPQVVAPIVGFVGIDYSYDFDVSAVGGRTVVSMSGAHDRFPAHEVYATAGGRSQLMHAFTPSLVLRAPGVPIAIPYVGPPLKLAGIIPPIPVFGWVLF